VCVSTTTLRRSSRENVLGAVSVNPVLDVGVGVVEEVGLHLLGALGLGGEGVGADTGVVDQNADALLLLLDLVVDAGNVLLLGDVSLDGVDGTWNTLAVLLGDSLELLHGAANDVDLGTVDGEGLSGHQTNTRSTT